MENLACLVTHDKPRVLMGRNIPSEYKDHEYVIKGRNIQPLITATARMTLPGRKDFYFIKVKIFNPSIGCINLIMDFDREISWVELVRPSYHLNI